MRFKPKRELLAGLLALLMFLQMSIPVAFAEGDVNNEATVTDGTGNISSYPTIEGAIGAAMGLGGSTVTLLKDVATEKNIDITAGNFTIDLNGKTWTGPKENEVLNPSTNKMEINYAILIYGTPTLVIKDTQGNGKFISENPYKTVIVNYSQSSNVQLEGGTFSGVYAGLRSIASLLSPQYGFKQEGGWVIDTTVKKLEEFTVLPVPAKISEQPKDVSVFENYTSVVIGLTAETIPADLGSPMTYQWYQVGTGSGGTDEMLAGETTANLSVPTGKPLGSYSFYCLVSCDGFTVKTRNVILAVCKESEAKVSLTSASGNLSYYPSIAAAVEAAMETEGCTLKLMDNIVTTTQVFINRGNFTIDLNGKTWSGTVPDNNAVLMLYTPTITLKDSGMNGKITGGSESTVHALSTDLTIESGTYENSNGKCALNGGNHPGVNKKFVIKGGSFIGGSTSPIDYPVVYFGSGSFFVSGGIFSGEVRSLSSQKVALTGGTYEKLYVHYFEGTPYTNVGQLLEKNFSYKNNTDGKWIQALADDSINPLAVSAIENVTVASAPIRINNQPESKGLLYGSASPTLSVTAEKGDGTTEGITYQWYRVGTAPGGKNQAIAGANQPSYTPTALNAGTHHFYCSMSIGDYNINSQSATLTVEKVIPTIKLKIFTREEAPFDYGNDVYLQAWVIGIGTDENAEKPDGTVTFKIDNEVIATSNFDSKFNTYTLGGGTIFNAGAHSFTAVYTPSTVGTGKNYVSVTSGAVEQAIAKAPQAPFNINAMPPKKFSDGNIDLETTGGSGTGAVTFSVPANNGVLEIEDHRAEIVGVGTVLVKASKSGDQNYFDAEGTCEVTITKGDAPVLVFPTISDLTYGQKLSQDLLIGGTTGLGHFNWRPEAKDLVPIVSEGQTSEKVIFTPSDSTLKNYKPIAMTEQNISFTVNKAQPTIILDHHIKDNNGQRQVLISATVPSVGLGITPKGTLKLIDCSGSEEEVIQGAEKIALTGDTATFTWENLSKKVYSLKAVYSGDGNYLTANSSVMSFDTTKLDQENFSIMSVENKSYGDETFKLLTTGGNGLGAVSYESADPSIISIESDMAVIHKAGTVKLTATKQGDDNYNAAKQILTVTIGKKNLTLKADDKLNLAKGSVLPKLTYNAMGLVQTDTFTIEPVMTTTAKNTNTVGEFPITISGGTVTNLDSYNISYVGGKMTVVEVQTNPDTSGGGSNSGSNGGATGGGGSGGSGGSSKEDTTPKPSGTPSTPTVNPVLPTARPTSQTTAEKEAAAVTPEAIKKAEEAIQRLTEAKKQEILQSFKSDLPYTLPKNGLSVELLKDLTHNQFSEGELLTLAKRPELLKDLGLDLTKFIKIVELKSIDNPSFKDVSPKDWAAESIKKAAQLGLVAGRPDGTFGPNESLQVGDAFTFLDRLLLSHNRMESKLPRSTVEKYFTDKEHWAFENMASVGSKLNEKTLKVMSEMKSKPLTRGLLAQALYELTNGDLISEKPVPTFTDTSNSANQEAIKYCVSTGLLKGTSKNTMSPEKELTRAELMAVLIRLDEMLK